MSQGIFPRTLGNCRLGLGLRRILLSLVLGQLSVSWADTPDYEIQREAASAPRWGQEYVFEIGPEDTARVQWLHIKTDQRPFVLQAEPLGPEQRALFEKLSPEKQALFLEKRRSLVLKLARVLSSTRRVWGLGSAAKDWTLEHVFRRRPQSDPLEPFVRFASRAGLPESTSSPTRSHRVVQDLLNILDRELWMHAPVMSEANEFGMTLFFDVGGGALVWDKGLYGSLGFGLTFAYNHSNHSLVFELFQDAQKGKRGLPVVAQVAACGKCLLSVSSQSREATTLFQSGRAVYPPGPIAVLDTPKTLQMGFSQGVGFPPLDTFYAMENELFRWTLIRVEASSTDSIVPKLRFDSILLKMLKGLVGSCQSALSQILGKQHQ